MNKLRYHRVFFCFVSSSQVEKVKVIMNAISKSYFYYAESPKRKEQPEKTSPKLITEIVSNAVLTLLKID